MPKHECSPYRMRRQALRRKQPSDKQSGAKLQAAGSLYIRNSSLIINHMTVYTA
ncbi:MAG TPA: hypothetical protein H9950_03695 [Candidatus Bacteroides avicola]|uniref:Uncharacterized protein n=1 Tax=Candidatus Bacteroides avicola TaxID=2838468 RepID=A0A9D2HUN8_9BACE|nr:hypothetical protein [Candidatus Bacteroides avicola]